MKLAKIHTNLPRWLQSLLKEEVAAGALDLSGTVLLLH